jgi:hypothetical protein
MYFRPLHSPISECLNRLEPIHNILHTQKNEIIVFGDININYLVDNNRKTCLNSLLISYNLSNTVNIQNNSISATDNIFIETSKLETYIFLHFYEMIFPAMKHRDTLH